jgi:hypothetical protein
MAAPEVSRLAAPADHPHLLELLEGLRRRAPLTGAARDALDRKLVVVAEHLEAAVGTPLRLRHDGPPPRRVGVAMALALHSAPHFAATLFPPTRSGAEDPAEPHRREPELGPIPLNETLERVLGLAGWEIDELREEVDRRVGAVLKRDRTVGWLWSWAGMPRSGAGTLGNALFPGLDSEAVSLLRRGGHIYAMNRSVKGPRASLWLPWLGDPEQGPTSGFRMEQVDDVVRKRLERGIGAEEGEVEQLLRGMIAMIPRRDALAMLQLDQWRCYGRATLTDLGQDYAAGRWLVQPIPADGAEWRSWLVQDEDGMLAVRGTVTKVFDKLALPRASAMLQQIYAGILSTVDAEGPAGPGHVHPDDLDLYDVESHLQAVMEPVFAWANRTETHRLIAREYRLDTELVADRLRELARVWQDHARRAWWGVQEHTPSILTILVPHLVALQGSLRRGIRRAPSGAPHADLLLLFVAHYVREARLERLWVPQLSDVVDGESELPPPEDIVGHWFWAVWQRLLEELDSAEGAHAAS